MTEDELLAAGLGRGEATGVPYVMHEELRELRELAERQLLALSVIRELLELAVAVLGVELDSRPELEASLECDDCGRTDGSHADGVEH